MHRSMVFATGESIQIALCLEPKGDFHLTPYVFHIVANKLLHGLL